MLIRTTFLKVHSGIYEHWAAKGQQARSECPVGGKNAPFSDWRFGTCCVCLESVKASVIFSLETQRAPPLPEHSHCPFLYDEQHVEFRLGCHSGTTVQTVWLWRSVRLTQFCFEHMQLKHNAPLYVQRRRMFNILHKCLLRFFFLFLKIAIFLNVCFLAMYFQACHILLI